MFRDYKYRVYANQETLANANGWLYYCGFLYNCALQERILAYKEHKVFITLNMQQHELLELKNEFGEYTQIDAQVLQDVLRRLDNSFRGFFGRIRRGEKAGFPRFKTKANYSSFTLVQNSWKVDGKYLFIRNVGKFKIKLSRSIGGQIKCVTLKRSPTNKWYVSFLCEVEKIKKDVVYPDKTIGIDVGINYYLADSEGNKVSNPKYLKESIPGLKIKQRKLSRAKDNSNRKEKTRIQLAKGQEKVSNQRKDFLHKLSTNYVMKYGIIKIENLAVSYLRKNHKLAVSIYDCSWCTFFELLGYKVEETGGQVIKVSARYTSMTCSNCGVINHSLKPSDRTWICASCGETHDRDINAAINIKNSEVRAEPSVANVSGYTKRRPRIAQKSKSQVSSEFISMELKS